MAKYRYRVKGLIDSKELGEFKSLLEAYQHMKSEYSNISSINIIYNDSNTRDYIKLYNFNHDHSKILSYLNNVRNIVEIGKYKTDAGEIFYNFTEYDLYDHKLSYSKTVSKFEEVIPKMRTFFKEEIKNKVIITRTRNRGYPYQFDRQFGWTGDVKDITNIFGEPDKDGYIFLDIDGEILVLDFNTNKESKDALNNKDYTYSGCNFIVCGQSKHIVWSDFSKMYYSIYSNYEIKINV